MTLSLYVARRFLASFAMVFGMFAMILYLIDFVDQIRRFDAGTVSLGNALELAALNVPGSVYRILPLIMILASISLFLNLARSSEMVVIRSSGRSALRMLVAPVVTALLLGAVAVAALNPVVSATARRYEALAEHYASGAGAILSISREGLWLRQGSAQGQVVIRAERSNADATELFDVTFIGFSTDAGPVSRIEAASARLTAGAWVLSGAKEWDLSGTPNPERAATRHASLEVPSELTADRIRDSFGTPGAIPVWDLPQFVADLERAGFSARKHLVWFQMELALPLLLASMVLVAAGFTLRHARFGNTGVLVLSAIGLGFAIFFLRNFAQVLGENGQIPVLLAAWSPPVAAVLLSLGLLLHLEDG